VLLFSVGSDAREIALREFIDVVVCKTQIEMGIFALIASTYQLLAVITRPPDGVLLARSALAARRLRRLASLVAL